VTRIEETTASRPRMLSPAQLPIWRAEVLHRHTPRWTQITVVRLSGPVDPARLEQAIGVVVARHPALRMRLERRAGKPSQLFAATGPFHLIQHERSVEHHKGVAAVEEFLMAAQRDLFTLYGGELFRASLLVLGNEQFVLVLCLHHLAADGVALGLVVPQIAVAYRGDKGDFEPDEAYERWLDRQEETTPAGLEAASLHYRGELAGAPLRSEKIYDRAENGDLREPPELVEVTCTLEAVVCNGLRKLARERGATLFIVLFAAYAATLRLFAKQDDLVIAAFVSRRAGEPAPIIGSCINTLLVRVRLGADDAPAPLIEAVKTAWRPVRRHQAIPLALLSGPAGAALPLAQYAINFLDMNETSFEVPGLSSTVTHAQQGFPLNDLLLYALREQDGRLRLRLIVGSGTSRLGQSRLDNMLGDLVRRLRDWNSTPHEINNAIP